MSMLDRNYFLKEVSKFDYINNDYAANFPLNVFPEYWQNIIYQLSEYAHFESQITANAMLFAVSTIIGNSRLIDVKESWKDTPNLWIAIVGKRGTMKSPTISYCLKPLTREERKWGDEFSQQMHEFLSLKTKDRKEADKPIRRQRFSNDTTVEGLIDAMQNNPNGMGIYKDELNGFFEEMSRYKAGGNLEFYLSAFNGGTYIKNRKSYAPQTVDSIFLSILGSIQPEVLKELSKKQTTNGMIDRWLYVISNDEIPHTTIGGIDPSIGAAYEMVMSNIISRCSEMMPMEWLPGGKEVFIDALNDMEDMMRDENTDTKIVTYLSKMKTYFARFCVIVAVIDGVDMIGIHHVNKAKQLAVYYITTAKSVFVDFENQMTLEKIYSIEKATTPKEKVFAVVKHLPELNNSQISRLTGLSRPTVIKYVKERKVGVKGQTTEKQLNNY